MVFSIFNFLLQLMKDFFSFLADFELVDGVSYLAFVVIIAISSLIASIFIPRGE